MKDNALMDLLTIRNFVDVYFVTSETVTVNMCLLTLFATRLNCVLVATYVFVAVANHTGHADGQVLHARAVVVGQTAARDVLATAPLTQVFL